MSSPAEAAAGGTGDPLLFAGGDDSACSTPFVSAPSSPSRDRGLHHHGAACFYSAPASPTRGGGAGKDFGGVLDFDFDFSSRFPSPSAAAMSSADELFCNGQIRPVRLSAALLQPQQPPSSPGSSTTAASAAAAEDDDGGLDLDERGRFRGRSVRRKARSLSPFRSHWRRSPAAAAAASPSPAPETESADEPAVTPAASRSSSSSSTASSASTTSSSSSSRGGSRRWARGFLKDLLHRSKSDGGHHLPTAAPVPATSPSPSAAPKRSPSPSPSPATRSSGAARGGRRRSAHERLYEARRAEAEEMRRRTNLPYRQGGFLLFGCIGLGHRSYGAVQGLARGLNAAAAVSRS
ncbi:hypothetical protein HU200_053994 [Digitaria exilis]|uniref:Uncharacterized protein n=1 Tax=Digitaria exilis TaxID=1010633 RepID=A0A835E7C3_9POAL|nr:hypothetical protein HU200_053994 [Digitaria exilis]